jgi:uncharacterized membrane protein YfhO
MPEFGTMRSDPGPGGSQSTLPREGGNRGLFHAAVGLVLVVLGLLLYRNFICGDNTLLYIDMGGDSADVFYPSYVLRSEYLRHVGMFSWSFQVGMGQNLFPSLGSILLTPVIWLPKGMIAKAIVYQHLLYVVISGLLFARFLAGRGLTFESSLLGAVLLSFSAYMCMGSCWYFHATEVVCFTFLLFAVGHAVDRGRWPYLVLGVAVVGLIGAFHLYLSALLLCFYVPVRLIERYSWQPLPILRGSVRLAGAAILGVGVSAIVAVSSVYALFNSPRGSGLTPLTRKLSSFPVFGLESHLHYITAALRPFANDLLGTGYDFRGWQNYLEAPMSYCGLLSLVMLPQVFIGAARRVRIVYILFLAAVLIPTVFPWFRYLFWAFQGDYYRTFSLFSVFGVITLAMTAFARYAENQSLNLWVLIGTIFVLMGVLFFPLREVQAVINPGVRLAITIFLLSYAVLLTIGQLLKRQRIVAWIIIALAAIEVFYLDRITIADRLTVTKQELKERVGYNDYTIDAVKDIKANDHSFFRISKTWSSSPASDPSLNDAMVFGYYGSESYSSFNDVNYINFLMAVDAISATATERETRWSRGLAGRPVLLTFACEKYVLIQNPALLPTFQNYEVINQYGPVDVLRNRNFLPLGLAYTRYIPEDLFRQLPPSIKAGALFYAVVLSNKDAANGENLSRMSMQALQDAANSGADVISNLRRNALSISSFSETRIEGSIGVNEKTILVFQTPFDPGWHAFVDTDPARVLKVDAGLLGVVLGTGQHHVVLRYRPPFLYSGAFLTLVSFVIFGLSLWRWPRIGLPH